MSELAAYLSKLPRLLTEKLTIKVSGEWTGRLPILWFYGSGTLTIQGEGTAVIHGGIQIYNCSCMVLLENLTVKAAAKMTGGWEHLVYCTAAMSVWVTDCILEGQGTSTGIRSAEGSTVNVIACSVTGCANAIETTTSSVVALVSNAGAGYANNDTGVCAYNGGIAILGSGVPELLGGTNNRKDGGVIIRQNGTLL